MEYLMTYGWAILIIAVVMVALFALGILGGNPLGTQCLPQPGFECTNPVLSAVSGNLIVEVGQIGQTWVSSNIAFVPQGTSVVGTLFLGQGNGGTANVVSGGLSAGQPQSVTISVTNPSAKVGSSYSGQLWIQYQTVSGGTPYYTELATITLKAG